MATYEVPAEPATGLAVDSSGITWRRNSSGTWDPQPCQTCGVAPSTGSLAWAQLLVQRGPLSDPPPSSLA